MKKRKCFKCGYWNKSTAEYCGLCYEPFNKRASAAADTVLRETRRTSLPLLALKAAAVGLLAASALVYFRLHPGGSGAQAVKPPPETNRFAEKTDEADRLFVEYEAARAALLADISAAPAAPGEFGIAGDYTRRLFDIEEAYAAGIERLALPAAGEVSPQADRPYLEWLEIHRHREARSTADFSGRYQKLLEQAGVGR